MRRYLVEHRFNAAQGLMGLVALTLALWLLWPQGEEGAIDFRRDLWHRTIEQTRQTTDTPTRHPTRNFVKMAEASAAVSAKEHLEDLGAATKLRFPRPRLAEVAATMPAIGLTEAAPATDPLGGPPVARLPRDGRTPTWLRNAVAAPLADGRPSIAVMIDDLGLNPRITAAVSRLPGPLSLAFLPYASGLERQARAARAAGHELLLHEPMQPVGSEWPGPSALLTSLSPAEMRSRLRTHLRSFRGFVGVNNHMGSAFTADRHWMAMVMEELRQRDLLFVDSRTTAKTVAASEARRHGVPFTARDVFLDNEMDAGYIRHQLRQLEAVARRKGLAVAIGHPHEVTIAALKRWLPTLAERGFALVPISTVVARENCDAALALASSACGRYVAAHNTIEQSDTVEQQETVEQ